MGDAAIIFGNPTADLGGRIGQVTLVIADARIRSITHLVITPDEVSVTARLVTIASVADVNNGMVRLGCSRAQFLAMPDAVSYSSVTNTTSLDGAAWLMARGARGGDAPPGGLTVAAYAVIPAGAVGLRRDQTVRATDGSIGRLVGVVGDLLDHRLTRLVVAEGHVFSKRNVTFEIDAIMEFADDVRLNLTRQQAEEVARPY